MATGHYLTCQILLVLNSVLVSSTWGIRCTKYYKWLVLLSSVHVCRFSPVLVVSAYIYIYFFLSRLFQCRMFNPGISASLGCMNSRASQTQGLLIFWFPMPELAHRPPRTEPRVCWVSCEWKKKISYRWHAEPQGWIESCDPVRARSLPASLC